jgi:HPt (histidine-containing phosphotransfer) domain-containing protein
MTLHTSVEQAPLIDSAQLADLRAALGDDESDLILGLMAGDIAYRVKAIVAAIAGDEGDKARAEAHSLRGAADGIGARRLARSCRAIEFGPANGLAGLSTQLTRCSSETIAAIAIARTQRVISRV